MEAIQNFSKDDLEQLSYRVLQQIAKGMSLPSNVKKMYLVQLIYAKTHKTEMEVAEIVQQVRYERQLSTQTNTKRKGKKKMRLQAMEVSSSNTCMSPPIDMTPKRASSSAYSPEMMRVGPVIKYHPHHPRSDSPKNTSDRVLRSYNIRSYKRPNYSFINNSVVELVKASERATSPKEKETQISIISHEGRHPRLNVTARCIVKKMRPIVSDHNPRSYLRRENIDNSVTTLRRENRDNSVTTSSFTQTQMTSKALVPATCARSLSEYVKSIGFKRTDGKISKINAVVQKPAPKIVCSIDLDAIEETSYKNVVVTIQDIYNSNNDAQTFTYPNVSEYTLTESNLGYNCHVPLSDVMPQKMVDRENEMHSCSVYYHKKIRAEQMRTKELPSLLPVSVARNTDIEVSLARNTASEVSVARNTAGKVSVACNTASEVSVACNTASEVSVACNTASEVSVVRNTSSEVSIVRNTANEVSVARNTASEVSVTRNTASEVSVACNTASEISVARNTSSEVSVARNTSSEVSVARNIASEQQLLPKISDVFSQLSDVGDVIRPIRTYTDDEKQSSPSLLPNPVHRGNTMLEGLYNLKSDTLSHPLVQVTTTTGTRCVFSTSTVTTAMQQEPASRPEPSNSYSEPASTTATYAGTSDEVARICELATFGEQDMTLRKYHEAALRDSISPASSQYTVDEMVEDAMEIISQDGDYMERIVMEDIRMQCVLCSWAGSKFNLEYHIRKEHESEITQQEKNEWNITYKLGSLVNQSQWLSHACERDGIIYIISVKYEDPDCLMASLTTITPMSKPEPQMGTLTLYNKVTGEPFSWHGQILEIHSGMPYENDPNCLTIELSKLELLPNSANIKLHNRSLVWNSPSKVVVGQPALNDIHIIIFVKLHDLDFDTESP